MILVVGGAGYIGSHVVKTLVAKHQVIVLDNLLTGHLQAVDNRASFIYGDTGDAELLEKIFVSYPVKAVLHFAASSLVGESLENPKKYYINNVCKTLNLLNFMLKHNVRNFLFSSTAAVYGLPENPLIDESTSTQPINPYGNSKLMIEKILADYAKAYHLNYTILRYFNAAGADAEGQIGESHTPETHLIPIILEHLAGKRKKVYIYGADYETKDGTCIRDYIHVTDLANAHILVLEMMLQGGLKETIYNLGNGFGYSVNEVLTHCEKITRIKPNVEFCDRRLGDPPRLVAVAKKIEKELGWKAERNLHEIIESAWKWHQNPKY